MKLYSLYFSPTGGTLKAARLLCSAWSCEVTEVDLSDRSFDTGSLKFEKGDVCLVSVPSFGGRVPQFIIPKLERMEGNGCRAVIATSFGNRAFDDTLLELKNTLELHGFVCVGAAAAVTQHSIAPCYGTGRPDADDEKELRDFSAKLKAAAESDSAAPVNVPGKYPYKETGKSMIIPAADDKCIRCGICASRCPVNAIPEDNPTVTDAEKCISCLQCISICPQKARSADPAILKAVEQRLEKVCSERKSNTLYI